MNEIHEFLNLNTREQKTRDYVNLNSRSKPTDLIKTTYRITVLNLVIIFSI